jgi:hypothetical protein
MVARELWVFQPEQKFGSESGSGHCGGDYCPAERGGEGVSETAPEGDVDDERDKVGKCFEEEVGMDDVGS